MNLIPLLTFESVRKVFGQNSVLEDFSWQVKSGESWVLVGNSGSGKSVTMKLAVGLLTPDAGNIIWDEHQRRNVGVVFQSSALFDSLTVWQNISFQSWSRGDKSSVQNKSEALEALIRVGLPESVAWMYPHELSGGMKRRVAMARATFLRPEIVFYDEPTAGLDPLAARRIGSLIETYHHESSTTSLTISHDLANLSAFGTNVAFLHKGSLVWRGGVEDFFKGPHPIIHSFLGRS